MAGGRGGVGGTLDGDPDVDDVSVVVVVSSDDCSTGKGSCTTLNIGAWYDIIDSYQPTTIRTQPKYNQSRKYSTLFNHQKNLTRRLRYSKISGKKAKKHREEKNEFELQQ